MKVPNLFSFATSELSQDAFIGWLLSWGKDEYAGVDQQLHLCARHFLAMLFGKKSPKFPDEIKSITVKKQEKGIDVLCIVNDEYAVIIEDKTWSNEHSNQLFRYYEHVLSKEYAKDKIIAIFYKTEDRSDYKKVIAAGYYPVTRRDIIGVLDDYKGNNNILLDYLAYLKNKENEVASFINIPIKQWTSYARIGLYQYLQELWGCGSWREVVNPTGGFLGFYWFFHKIEGGEVYLQIENNKLCFKISADDDANRKNLRTKWHKLIMQIAKNRGCHPVVSKPGRFGTGKYMTVCVIDKCLGEDTSVIILAEAVNTLEQAKLILAEAIRVSEERNV